MVVVGAALVRKATRFVPVRVRTSILCGSSKSPCQANEQLQDFYIPGKSVEMG